MDPFLQIIASNALIAAALAVPAALATHARVNPAVVHVLWLLVLVKLFTPPVLPVPVPWPQVAVRSGTPAPLPAAEPPRGIESAGRNVSRLVGPACRSSLAAGPAGGLGRRKRFDGGPVRCARILLVRRFLRQAAPAPDFLREIAHRQSGLLALTTVPDVVTLPCCVTPAVWSLGGSPRIVFPADLVRGMERDRLETLMAH